MTDPVPARRVGHQPTLLQLRGWVHYHQVYLLEAGSDLSGMLDDGLASPVGIMDFPPWAGHRGYAARVDGSGRP